MPHPRLHPPPSAYTTLNLTTSGALLRPVPLGAPCFATHPAHNTTLCAALLANWTKSDTHARHPTSAMSPLYQGDTCNPAVGAASPSAVCAVGGSPMYVVRADNVAQVQLAVNFARNTGVRLVVRNTGHDFLGRSAGAESLGLWVGGIKGLEYDRVRGTVRMGAGTTVREVYELAEREGFTAVGGECGSVGAAGGGGGGTFGVVTAVTVRVWPKMGVAGVKFVVSSGTGARAENGNGVFWEGMYAYWRRFEGFADKGSYGYSQVFPNGEGGYTWSMLPWLVPGMGRVEFEDMVKPLLEEWKGLGLKVKPEFFEHDSLYQAWTRHFPSDGVANSNLRVGSRLFPRSVWQNSTRRDELFDTIRAVIEDGSALIQYNIKAVAPPGTPESAANSHWRDTLFFGIFGGFTAEGEEGEKMSRKVTDDWLGRLKKFGTGAYGNEADVMEPDFGEAFWGKNYPRLLRIKKEVDPDDLFWVQAGVGSEGWKVASNSRKWLSTQDGLLCRV
ncbi:hypothetical protein B0T18DRAFT_429941 [Schizothecium vesticola]|uniref:FAD-binding PCMH-type domain-containing protein n=1 Tax=Schizothecium vesticola TaxID=314040 RepID=A0AA40K5W1_9PEZI|nr:hypothetical protein B0T18DRAFT_429941 [Schizothecium vesticola]